MAKLVMTIDSDEEVPAMPAKGQGKRPAVVVEDDEQIILSSNVTLTADKKAKTGS